MVIMKNHWKKGYELSEGLTELSVELVRGQPVAGANFGCASGSLAYYLFDSPEQHRHTPR